MRNPFYVVKVNGMTEWSTDDFQQAESYARRRYNNARKPHVVILRESVTGQRHTYVDFGVRA